MSQSEKAAYFQALKSSGVTFDKHYREYTTDELKVAYDALAAAGEAPPLQIDNGDAPSSEDQPLPGMPSTGDNELDEAASSFFGLQQRVPQAAADPEEMAGQRLNSQEEDQPIRTDEMGRLWFQEEVRKPSYPKPRGRRVLRVADPGVTTQTIKSGDYIESFEVAGNEVGRTSEIKVTLPSYQVGIYKDPRFPFKVHTYNGLEGFDLFEVADYYGGREMVPPEIKRVYVENVLCYDIRTTVRAINEEYRQLQLAGKA